MVSGLGLTTGQPAVKKPSVTMLSEDQHPTPIDSYLAKEIGRIAGPVLQDLAGFHVSMFGVIPKPHLAGRVAADQ